jgi:hypothetical protein
VKLAVELGVYGHWRQILNTPDLEACSPAGKSERMWGMHMAVGASCCYCTSFLTHLVLRGSHASPSELAPLVYKVDYVK